MTMPETFQCPECGKRYRLRPDLAGRSVRCAGCAHVFRAPAVSSADAPAKAATAPPKIEPAEVIDAEVIADTKPRMTGGTTPSTESWQIDAVVPTGPKAAPSLPDAPQVAAEDRPGAPPPFTAFPGMQRALSGPTPAEVALRYGAGFFHERPLDEWDKALLGFSSALALGGILCLVVLAVVRNPAMAATIGALRYVAGAFGVLGAGLVSYALRKRVALAFGLAICLLGMLALGLVMSSR